MAEADRGWLAVIGSSRGIGRETALALAADGWNVVTHGRTADGGAKEVAEEIRRLGRGAVAVGADLVHPEASAQLVDDAWRAAGELRAWIHLAGADLLTGPQARWSFRDKLELVTKVDVWGTMLACRAAGARLSVVGDGVIITMGWDQSATGMEGDTGELFAASKGAIAAFSRSLSKSLAPSVRVHCVAPGWIRTAWGESASLAWQQRAQREALLKRWGAPRDVADAIVFLCSDRARFLTGQTFLVNGGAVTS